MDQFNGINGTMNGTGAGGPLDPSQTAWGMFALTGGIGYYLLYKELMGGGDGRDKRLD